MRPTLRFVIVTAVRDRLFTSLLALLVITFGISAYLGSTAIEEATAMMVVYMGGAARVVLVMGLVVFTAFHVERLYETREIEAILSRAISREKFIVSYWAGLAVIALFFILPIAGATIFFGLSRTGAILWSLSVLLECLILVAFALFAALTMERAIPTIFASIGFYVLARLMGFFAGIATAGTQQGLNRIANPIMEALNYVAPRLDLMGQTRWLVYGPENADVVAVVAAQTALYIPLLLTAAMFDLRRKHF